MTNAPETPLKLAEMTYEEAEAQKGALALLPTGATEAHGPHLPLMTDVIISEEAALRTARALRAEGIAAVVLPPVAYAVTEYAADFGGTISVREETTRALVVDVILGAERAGFRGTVIINAHLEPENISALETCKAEASDHGAHCVFPNIVRRRYAERLGEEFKSGACHAGSYETSLVLAARPELVKRGRMAGLPPNPTSLVTAAREGNTTFKKAGGHEAYFGFPADASAEEGEALYAELVRIYVEGAKTLL
ncbi:MAG: creatininase family protein [Myxococcota bacterium]